MNGTVVHEVLDDHTERLLGSGTTLVRLPGLTLPCSNKSGNVSLTINPKLLDVEEEAQAA